MATTPNAAKAAIEDLTGGIIPTPQDIANWNAKNLAERPSGSWNPVTNTPALATLLLATGDYADIAAEGSSSIPTGVAEDYKFGDFVVKTATGFSHRRKAAVAGSETVDDDKFAKSVKLKNFPFDPTITTIDDRLKAWIKSIKIYTPDSNKQFTIGGIKKLAGSGLNEWGIYLYDVLPNGNRGANTIYWNATNYAPSTSPIDLVTFTVGNFEAEIGIDWTLVPDNTNINIATVSTSLISRETYQNRGFIDRRINAIFSNGSVTDLKFDNSVVTKNLPFAPNTSPNPFIKAAIKAIFLYDVAPGKLYCIGQLKKNATGSATGSSVIYIYEWLNGAFGANAFPWSKVGHVATGLEKIVIKASSGEVSLLIDWDALPEAYSATSVGFASSGISKLTYYDRSDYQSYIDARILAFGVPAESVAPEQLAASVPHKNWPFAASASSLVGELKNSVKAITLFNTDPTKKYMIGGIRKNQISAGQTTPGRYAIYIYSVSLSGVREVTNFSFDNTAYTPANPTWDIIRITNQAGMGTELVIDWTAIPDNTVTNYNNANQGLISDTCRYSDWRTLALIAANPPVVADTTVTKVKLGTDVKTKNLPFESTANALSSLLVAAVKDVALYGTVPEHQYMIGGIKKVAGAYSLFVYNVVNGVRVTNSIFWSNDAYTPKGKPDTIYLGGGSMGGTVLIDWDQVPEGTNLNYTNINNSLLSESCKKPLRSPMPIVMPSKVFMFPDSQYWFYANTILRNSSAFEKGQNRLSILAKAADGTTTITTAYSLFGDFGYLKSILDASVTFRVLSNDYTESDVVVSSHTLTIKQKAKPTGKTIKKIVIGDSYMNRKDGDGVMAYQAAMAANDGNTIQHFGTRKAYTSGGVDYYSEARAGWSEYTFFRYVPVAQRISANGDTLSPNMHSPFMFSPDDTAASAYFSFAEYLTTYGFPVPDVVEIFLGMNGGWGPKIAEMVTSIKAVSANIKILIHMVPGAEFRKENNDSVARQLGRITQNQQYILKFDGREAEGIYLIATHACFHREACLINTIIQQVQFNLNNYPTVVSNSDHHPNESGAKVIAYMGYNYTLYSVA